jgi:hypothetical protein
MSKLAIRLKPETVRTLAGTSVVAGYTAVGTEFLEPSRILILQNLSDEAVMFSFDGVNDHIAVPGPGSFVLDITSNKGVAGALFVAQGTIIYVKRIGTPTTGSIYVSTFYGDSGY